MSNPTPEAHPSNSSQARLPVAHYGQNSVRNTEGLRDYMRSYTPHMATVDWEAVRPFVLDCVLPIPVPHEEGARRLLRPLSRLAHWARTVASLPLDADLVLDPDTINEFVATLPREKARTFQGALFTIARTRGVDDAARACTFSHSIVSPYTDNELGVMASYVSSLTRSDDARTANAAMGICGGAGLRRRELLTLTRGDIIETPAGWNVRVGGNWPRTVPVLNRWESYIDRAIESADDPSELVVPATAARSGDHRLQRMMRHARRSGSIAPDCSRLRTTWVLRFLNLLTLGDLQHVAGYSNSDFLRHYTSHVTRRLDSALDTILRGADTEANR